MQASASQVRLSVGESATSGSSPAAPNLYSWESARLPRELVLEVAASCPEALGVLCRVCRFAAESGLCFAKQSTLRAAGLSMTLPVLRRGLRWLVAHGVLSEEASLPQGVVVYRPLFERKPPDSVFIPTQVWRWRKPTEIAMYAVWAAGGQGLSAPELGQRIAGRGGKMLSRSRSFAVFRTLVDAGLIPSDSSPELDSASVRKSIQPRSRKPSTNTDSFNSGLLNSGEGRPPLFLVSDPESRQLEFPFMRNSFLTAPTQFIDWLAVVGLDDGDDDAGRTSARREVGTHRAEAPSGGPHREPAPRDSARVAGAGVREVSERKDRALSGGRKGGPAGESHAAGGGLPAAVPPSGFHLEAWTAIRERAGLKFGQRFGANAGISALGVSPSLEVLFVAACHRLQAQGATVEDFRTLGDFIAQDGLRFSGNKPIYQVVCEQLEHQLNRAVSWDAENRPAQERGGPKPPTNPGIKYLEKLRAHRGQNNDR